MTFRLIAFIVLAVFAYTEATKFMAKKEKELTIENLREQLELKNGDIIVQKDDNSTLENPCSLDGFEYSHIGLLANSENGFVVFHIKADENGDELRVSTIKDFVNFSKKIAVYRYKNIIDEDKLSQILTSFLENKPKFDYEFSLENSTFYCTEFVNEIYFRLFGENLYTYLYDFNGKNGISINSIIKNPNLEKRYELKF